MRSIKQTLLLFSVAGIIIIGALTAAKTMTREKRSLSGYFEQTGQQKALTLAQNDLPDLTTMTRASDMTPAQKVEASQAQYSNAMEQQQSMQAPAPAPLYSVATQPGLPVPAVFNEKNLPPSTMPSDEAAPATTSSNTTSATAAPPIADSSFNVEAKKKEVIDLVDRGINYLMTHPPHDAFQAFARDKHFKVGELCLFVFDTNGVCLVHGEELNLVWENLFNMRGSYGSLIVQDIIKKAQAGGGWFTYRWRNATQNAYIKQVSVGNKTYVVGAGYYPHSKADAVVNLVKSAVSLFNSAVKDGRPISEVLSLLSWPLGPFVFGDLYVYALDFNGMQFAHGDLPGLIGSSAWDYKDASGKYINQEIIKKLKERGSGGIWMDYISKNTQKLTYAEKVVDAQGKEYFIACGYYPKTTISEVQNLVRRGYEFMKKSGKSRAVAEFNDPFSKEFRFGDLYLFVYDKNGVLIANGSNPSLVGNNQFNNKDDSGSYYVQTLIKKAENGGGTVEAKTKGSFQSFYVEEVNLGIETFIIGSSVYPISKEETMLFMAKSGASYLTTNEPEEAFKEFVKKDGKFIRGDMSVFVIDEQGICYAWGDNYDLIWRNLINLKDDNGKSYIKMFINTAKRGADIVTYTLYGKTRKVRLEPVTKNGNFYVVGSEFCL
jgi:signal transduction histidine kinase